MSGNEEVSLLRLQPGYRERARKSALLIPLILALGPVLGYLQHAMLCAMICVHDVRQGRSRNRNEKI